MQTNRSRNPQVFFTKSLKKTLSHRILVNEAWISQQKLENQWFLFLPNVWLAHTNINHTFSSFWDFLTLDLVLASLLGASLFLEVKWLLGAMLVSHKHKIFTVLRLWNCCSYHIRVTTMKVYFFRPVFTVWQEHCENQCQSSTKGRVEPIWLPTVLSSRTPDVSRSQNFSWMIKNL